jgi:hypothetical protein
MFRIWIAALLCLAISASPSRGQEWARKMFAETSHDFGAVARGAKVEHRFVVKNIYEEDVHIASVRSSCGCTTPQISQKRLKTWETAEIVAVFNTRSFVGMKTATLTVQFDRPYRAEVQLDVKGYIRSDVTFEPGSVHFGELQQGEGAEVPIRVNYAGRGNWRIVDVRSSNPHFEVELSDPQRRGQNVSFDMLVRLLPDAPIGYLNDQLTIISNDASRQGISLAVEGRVRSPLTVSPSPLILGVLSPGEQVTKKILVRAKTPFRITGVHCSGSGCFEFDVDTERQSTTHFIPVTFIADPLGRVEEKLRIQTDLGDGTEVELVASAEVRELAASATSRHH